MNDSQFAIGDDNMSEIKWIKVNTNMPENRKIKRIRRLPDGNNIVLFWVFLLTRAGESNKRGGLFFLDDMPYTVDDLAEEFDFSYDFVQFALKTLEKLQMIELFDDIIYIKNWEKYQNIEGMERVRKLTAERNRRYRERKRQERLKQNDVTVTSRDATEEELELDKEVDKEKDYDSKIKDLLSFFSSVNNFTNLNKKYWDIIRETRKTGKIAESVIYNNMAKWKKYNPIVVGHALKEHISNHKGKREEYTLGIMRNTNAEEVKSHNKKNNRRVARF